ncbi:acyl-CoA dehydrogenase [Trebonia kvetii]|uniref:Acyl-CoA dehydrogenase n=1 Tax=Trebonia kvetii TaxID=2480626 RepID=A0A6P2BSW0_9ACTN|nr:acyl-CoA dehydrogenase family protein [Trebonia kvetii]TVZ02152.1 acyl-CoA dehydrogenase [Trebonia kvetii]
MRFGLDETALALRDAAAGLLASEVTPAVIRDGWPGGTGKLVSAAWQQLAGVGALGALVPEERDGLGLDENSLVPLLEEVGRSGLPGPAAETIAVAAPLLAENHLAGLLAGEVTVAAQLTDGSLVPHCLVQHGATAPLIVLRAGGALRLYERGELELEPVTTVDGSLAAARLARRPAAGGTLLSDDPAVVEAAWRRGVLATSALLIGLSSRMLDLTVGYVKQREQYGVPIGSFQAVKHALANALVAVEFARPLALAAAWYQTAGAEDAAAYVSAAKAAASDAAALVARTAIQCHGAIGFTIEYELHLYAKRAWALIPAWGSPDWHRGRLATLLGVSDD